MLNDLFGVGKALALVLIPLTPVAIVEANVFSKVVATLQRIYPR